MARKSIDLLIDTPAEWVAAVLADFDAFLADHANCERKASALAMSMVVKYPDREKIIPDLIALAQEELEHFRQVYAVMEQRGVALARDTRDPYAIALVDRMRHGRQERFLDRLLVASVIECRGAERFRLVSEHIDDGSLRVFYRDLWASEAKHGNVFVDFALRYFAEKEVYGRLDEWVASEAEVVRSLTIRPALH